MVPRDKENVPIQTREFSKCRDQPSGITHTVEVTRDYCEVRSFSVVEVTKPLSTIILIVV
jgi:hypothetical protein